MYGRLLHRETHVSGNKLICYLTCNHFVMFKGIFVACCLICLQAGAQESATIVLFDGSNLDQWEGDSSLWHIDASGAVTAGDLRHWQAENEFLCTRRDYKNFMLDLDFKLDGDTGFLNAGIQIHSQRSRVPPLNEMIGYQVDIGDGYWGSIYDESRRNRIIAKANDSLVATVLKRNDWNHYRILCSGRRIAVYLNGVKTVDFTESNKQYPQHGRIGLQIHGHSYTKISYRNVVLTPESKAGHKHS